MDILKWLRGFREKKAKQKQEPHTGQPTHNKQNDNHQHEVAMVLTGKPKVENSCKECGAFAWEPPDIVTIAFAQHPIQVQELMKEAWIFASLITSEVVVAAKCPHAAAILKNVFLTVRSHLLVTGHLQMRPYQELAPKDLDTRWVVHKNGSVSVDIDCEFCGHMVWSPPEFVNSLKDKELQLPICAIAATMLHLATDMTICFFHHPPMIQMLFSPAYTEARNLLLELAITPIVHTAEEMKQCNMEDQTEFFRELFGGQ